LRATVKAASGLLRRTPRLWALAVGDLAGRAWWVLSARDRMHARRNLRWIFAPKLTYFTRERIARYVFRRVARNIVETALVFGASRKRILELVDVVGRDRFDDAYNEGGGVIAITGHYGCWELLAAWFAASGYKTAVVGRQASDARTTSLLRDARATLPTRRRSCTRCTTGTPWAFLWTWTAST
jgi:KDO2-lipid IV(A) lauroyltransferase